MPRAFLNRYIGIPFKLGGRTERGIDCYGLLRLFYLQEFDTELPDFVPEGFLPSEQAMSDIFRQAIRSPLWQETDKPVYGDVVVMRSGPWPCHCGIMISATRMLHAFEGSDSCCVDINTPQWERRVVGFFRLEVQRSRPDTSR